MTRIHNQSHLKQRRKELRNNATAAEATLWKFLQHSQLEGRKFRRQHSIGSYIVDFYCPSEKLVIELDGDAHYNSGGYERDSRRTKYLESLNLRVIRFENDEVFKATVTVLEKIKSFFGKSTTPNPSFSKEGNSNPKANLDSPPVSVGVAKGQGGKNSHSKITNSIDSPPASGGVAEGRGGYISSTHNPKIKSLLALDKPRERRKQQLFVIEGKKEIGMALDAGYKISNLFYCDDIISLPELKALKVEEKFLVRVTRAVFDKIAVRENSGGVIAVAEMKVHSLNQIKLSKNPLLLILEGVEKPGNLGAILRTADASGADAVIICDPQTDFYNPNVIRSSIGCIFTKQVAAATSEETIQWLKKNNIFILCTYLEASKPYHTLDYTKPSAIVMGTESTGLTELWTKNADANIIIPMGGKIDSMNVSTAAAVVVFEARRQRGF